jgi:hypothetical protein
MAFDRVHGLEHILAKRPVPGGIRIAADFVHHAGTLRHVIVGKHGENEYECEDRQCTLSGAWVESARHGGLAGCVHARWSSALVLYTYRGPSDRLFACHQAALN